MTTKTTVDAMNKKGYYSPLQVAKMFNMEVDEVESAIEWAGQEKLESFSEIVRAPNSEVWRSSVEYELLPDEERKHEGIFLDHVGIVVLAASLESQEAIDFNSMIEGIVMGSLVGK